MVQLKGSNDKVYYVSCALSTIICLLSLFVPTS